MSFKLLTEEEFKRFSHNRGRYKVEKDVADFLASDAQYGLLDQSEYKSISSVYATYYNAIRRMGLKNQVRLSKRGNNLFIIKVVKED